VAIFHPSAPFDAAAAAHSSCATTRTSHCPTAGFAAVLLTVVDGVHPRGIHDAALPNEMGVPVDEFTDP
jgi:hypothetical protein